MSLCFECYKRLLLLNDQNLRNLNESIVNSKRQIEELVLRESDIDQLLENETKQVNSLEEELKGMIEENKKLKEKDTFINTLTNNYEENKMIHLNEVKQIIKDMKEYRNVNNYQITVPTYGDSWKNIFDFKGGRDGYIINGIDMIDAYSKVCS